jgi:hypothetical protein
MAARRDPITAEDLRAELEALDGHAYNLQVLRERIDTSVGVLHDQITPHDLANVRAIVREAVALWDRISVLYESHTDRLPDLTERNPAVPFRMPRADTGFAVKEQTS